MAQYPNRFASDVVDDLDSHLVTWKCYLEVSRLGLGGIVFRIQPRLAVNVALSSSFDVFALFDDNSERGMLSPYFVASMCLWRMCGGHRFQLDCDSVFETLSLNFNFNVYICASILYVGGACA